MCFRNDNTHYFSSNRRSPFSVTVNSYPRLDRPRYGGVEPSRWRFTLTIKANPHLQNYELGYGSHFTNRRRFILFSEANESFFIGDTEDGQVLLTRSSAADLVAGPRQLLLITGKDHVVPPKMLMSRKEFWTWRDELKKKGCSVDLRFAS